MLVSVKPLIALLVNLVLLLSMDLMILIAFDDLIGRIYLSIYPASILAFVFSNDLMPLLLILGV